MIIVHGYMAPAMYDSTLNGKRYMVVDGDHREVPNGTTWKDIMFFKKPSKHERNEALKIRLDWEIDGSKGKKYTVKVDDNVWSCSCPAYGWSGNTRKCKHITQVKTENGWN